MEGQLHRYAAFTDTPGGGNPAGVWIGEALPDAAEMQRIAAEVGYSETAFISPAQGHRRKVRYYSPLKEIDFCGHATIASGVVLGKTEGAGTYQFSIKPGEIQVDVNQKDGGWLASLNSVTPQHKKLEPGLLTEVLTTLGWNESDLNPALPPMLAYAGAWHLVIAVHARERLAKLEYDFNVLKTLMLAHELTTLQLVWKENGNLYHSRNPFPVGGVIEDPATGAAAAALGGYLRDEGLVEAPSSILIKQGEDMGRPSTLFVDIPATGGIVVSGYAIAIESEHQSDN